MTMRLDRSRTRLTQKSQWWVYAPYPQKKEKHPSYDECPERITGDEAKTVNKRFRWRKSTKQGVGKGRYSYKHIMLLYPKHIFNAYRLRYIASFGIYALTNSKLCDSTGLESITFRLLAGLRPLSAKKKNTHFSVSVPSRLRVTRRKRLISVFGEGSRQSKEL